MSLFNRMSITKKYFHIALVLFGYALIGGCGFSPLYASKTEVSSIQEEMATIEVFADRTVFTELNFLLKNGVEASDNQYRLNVSTTETGYSTLVENLQHVPIPQSFTISGKFSLTEIETGHVILSGTTFSNASYFTSSQRFANLRAHRDASIRAKKELARNLHARLGAFFAGRNSIEWESSG